MALASRSDIERRYNRLLATYTIWVPSGEMATNWRPRFVNCWPSGSVNERRVIGGEGADGLRLHAAAPTSIPARSAARRREAHASTADGEAPPQPRASKRS